MKEYHLILTFVVAVLLFLFVQSRREHDVCGTLKEARVLRKTIHIQGQILLPAPGVNEVEDTHKRNPYFVDQTGERKIIKSLGSFQPDSLTNRSIVAYGHVIGDTFFIHNVEEF